MRDLIARLHQEVPGACTDRAHEAPVPPWWPTDQIDRLPRVLQVSGQVMDVNSMELSDDLAGLFNRTADTNGTLIPLAPAGSWNDEADDEQGLGDVEPALAAGLDVLGLVLVIPLLRIRVGSLHPFVRSGEVGSRIRRASGCTQHESYRAAWDFLLAHELAHFKADLLVTGAEFLSKKPLYIAGRGRQGASSVGGMYEEALATAIGRHALARVGRRSLDDLLRRAPAGYRDWPTADVRDGWARAIGEAVNGSAIPVLWAPPGTSAAPYEADVQVFLIIDSPIAPGRLTSAFVGPITGIVETKAFLKDLRALARGDKRVTGQWEARKGLLAEGALGAGSHLELIDSKRSLYSVRLDRNRRVGLHHDRDAAEWSALAAGNHDDLYDRMTRLDLP